MSAIFGARRHNRRAVRELRWRHRHPFRLCVPPTPCADCRMNVTPCPKSKRLPLGNGWPAPAHGPRCWGSWEQYMLRDDVWAAAAGDLADTHGVMLCIGCVERRLGRELTRDDFNWSLGINSPSEMDTDRLADRKGQRTTARRA